jgi:predicted DCC family thiol-disulfide oxidoreductase YuxK
MKRLYVLYDQECALCGSCRWWLMRQQPFIELYFIPLQSPEVARRFPGLKEWDQLDLREKLVVVSDEGAVYQGQYAWIMCLYALREYREWAQRLAHPTMLPFARRVCELVSRNRYSISRILKGPAHQLAKNLSALQPPATCPVGERCSS